MNLFWWARRDLNPQPRDYESPALTVELQARIVSNYCILLILHPSSECLPERGFSAGVSSGVSCFFVSFTSAAGPLDRVLLLEYRTKLEIVRDYKSLVGFVRLCDSAFRYDNQGSG
jgi:hypothetical protein